VILPDVNVLVYAFRQESVRHTAYADWLAGLVAGEDELALNDQVLGGFVRIVTNRRIYADPAPTATALAFVDALRAARRARWLPAGGAAWDRLGSLVAPDRREPGARCGTRRSSPRARVPDGHGGPRFRSVSCVALLRPGTRSPQGRLVTIARPMNAELSVGFERRLHLHEEYP